MTASSRGHHGLEAHALHPRIGIRVQLHLCWAVDCGAEVVHALLQQRQPQPRSRGGGARRAQKERPPGHSTIPFVLAWLLSRSGSPGICQSVRAPRGDVRPGRLSVWKNLTVLAVNRRFWPWAACFTSELRASRSGLHRLPLRSDQRSFWKLAPTL